MKKCILCGSPITTGRGLMWDVERGLLSFQGEHIQYPAGNEPALMDILWRANQKLVSHDRIESYIWGWLDVDARGGLNVLKYKVSKRIPEHFPLTIHNVPNWQGAGGGYWLER